MIVSFREKELKYIHKNVVSRAENRQENFQGLSKSFEGFEERIIGTYIHNDTRGSEGLVIRDFIEQLSDLVEAIEATDEI